MAAKYRKDANGVEVRVYDDPNKSHGKYFKFLGHLRGDFYYAAHRAQEVIVLTANQHTQKNLLRLAPREWWEDNRFGYLTGDSVMTATDWLVEQSYKAGKRPNHFYPAYEAEKDEHHD